MTIAAFDVDSYNKPGFDFRAAYAEGYRAGYIKLGGDNLNPRYCGSGYQNQFNAFVAAGFEHRGCYWVTGGNDPVASAKFYLANRDPRTTFDVLDNETLDEGRSWSDAEACAFFDVLIAAGLTDLWQYGSRDSLWNTRSWPGLQARGVKAIVAIYNDAPFSNVIPRTYPAELVKGHQFTSSATIGGLGAIDANQFTADAFTGTASKKTDQGDESMKYIWTQNRGGALVGETGYYPEGPYAAVALQTFGTAGTLNDAQWDQARQDAIDRGAAFAAQVAAQVQVQSGAPIDYDKLAAAVVSKMPPTALTIDDVKAALSTLVLTAK